ncbi:hypothetical protein ANCCAN_15133 [Ancylostoma caninum]|uniref:Secreted protein n=1 Tax=Ancylostoma caninum TaxID=29170 RepID=A0A368G3E5_ANCCA|nr:hypothetical protein ANCCAN_15133 [Ancylostoma caninum]
MIERWRTTTTLLYIAVFWSCICCDNVCFADGFRNLVSAYIDVHRSKGRSFIPLWLKSRAFQIFELIVSCRGSDEVFSRFNS